MSYVQQDNIKTVESLITGRACSCPNDLLPLQDLCPLLHCSAQIVSLLPGFCLADTLVEEE